MQRPVRHQSPLYTEPPVERLSDVTHAPAHGSKNVYVFWQHRSSNVSAVCEHLERVIDWAQVTKVNICFESVGGTDAARQQSDAGWSRLLALDSGKEWYDQLQQLIEMGYDDSVQQIMSYCWYFTEKREQYGISFTWRSIDISDDHPESAVEKSISLRWSERHAFLDQKPEYEPDNPSQLGGARDIIEAFRNDIALRAENITIRDPVVISQLESIRKADDGCLNLVLIGSSHIGISRGATLRGDSRILAIFSPEFLNDLPGRMQHQHAGDIMAMKLHKYMATGECSTADSRDAFLGSMFSQVLHEVLDDALKLEEQEPLVRHFADEAATGALGTYFVISLSEAERQKAFDSMFRIEDGAALKMNNLEQFSQAARKFMNDSGVPVDSADADKLIDCLLMKCFGNFVKQPLRRKV